MRVTPRPPVRSVRPPVRLVAGGRLGAGLGGALVVALVISGCAAGQRAQTANEFSVVDGVSANVGAMGVRNAGISAPTVAAGYKSGASATLSMMVVNTGDGSDKLVSVSTPNAASATIVGPASATPTAAATAAAIVVPANGAVPIGLGAGSGTITLRKLTYSLVPGQSIPVTLTFQGAGPVTVLLPVKLVSDQTGGESADVSPTTGPAN